MTTGRVYSYSKKHYINLTNTKTKQTKTFLKGKPEQTQKVCNKLIDKGKRRESGREKDQERELRNGRKETLSGSRRTEWSR